jgi:hypothetical protein
VIAREFSRSVMGSGISAICANFDYTPRIEAAPRRGGPVEASWHPAADRPRLRMRADGVGQTWRHAGGLQHRQLRLREGRSPIGIFWNRHHWRAKHARFLQTLHGRARLHAQRIVCASRWRRYGRGAAQLVRLAVPLRAAGTKRSTCGGICTKPSGATSDTTDIGGGSNPVPNPGWRLAEHHASAAVSKRGTYTCPHSSRTGSRPTITSARSNVQLLRASRTAVSTKRAGVPAAARTATRPTAITEVRHQRPRCARGRS